MSASRFGSARTTGRVGFCYLAPLALVLTLVGAPVEARWFARLAHMVEHAGGQAAPPAASFLDSVSHRIKMLAGNDDRARIPAEATPEGHWSFVNTTGEVFIAASAEELQRAIALLAPQAIGKGLYANRRAN
jgi:hypothetical protein